MIEFHAGDIVSCKDERYFAQLGLKKNVGIVLEAKKTSCKVMFDDFGGGYFLREEYLKPADPMSVRAREAGEAILTVSELARLLDAESIEVEKKGKRIRLSLFTGELSLEQLDQLRKKLSARLERLQILPHMMAELQVQLEYRV